MLEYGKNHIQKLQAAGRIGNSIVYSCALNKLREYAKRQELTFDEIDYSYIDQFNTSLLAEGIKVNSISNYLRTIRSLFNKAIKERLIASDAYPFRDFTIKSEPTINRTLSIAEIANIANCSLMKDSPVWHYRNLFLLSYCLIGINFSDLLTLTEKNFMDERVIFRRRKTNKVYSILIHPTAKELLSNYRLTNDYGPDRFVLPFVVNKNDSLLLKKDILQVIKTTNKYLGKIAYLCKINKSITTYHARYSWANVARVLGYSKDLIAEALGHEYGNKVTGIYLDNYGSEIIDEMNARVIEASFDTNLAKISRLKWT
ncbi:MAG: tyrosine-type recombinase/integrase [Chitinophagales bacterium]